MAVSLIPVVVVAVVAAFALSGKKKATNGGGGSFGGGDGPGGKDFPPGVEDCPDCLDPSILAGMAPALAAQVAAALQTAAVLGPAALLDLAATVAKSGAPNAACAAACLKEAAGKIMNPGSGLPGFFPGLFGGGGSGGGGMASITTLPTYPAQSPGAVLNPNPTGPFDLLLLTEPTGAPSPPFLLAPVGTNQWAGAPFFIRSKPGGGKDTPATLAQYYTGVTDRFHEIEQASSGAQGPSVGPLNGAGGPNWNVGTGITLPASWQPYSRPLPVAGGVTPMADLPQNYPPRPPVPALPGVNF